MVLHSQIQERGKVEFQYCHKRELEVKWGNWPIWFVLFIPFKMMLDFAIRCLWCVITQDYGILIMEFQPSAVKISNNIFGSSFYPFLQGFIHSLGTNILFISVFIASFNSCQKKYHIILIKQFLGLQYHES